MSYLLDTCIISKLRRIKKKPIKVLEEWIALHDESEYFLSALTLGEIQAGIRKLNPQKKSEAQVRITLEEWLFGELIPQFGTRILPVNLEIALQWGRLSGEVQQKGLVIPVADGLIASTAIVNNLTVVTENSKDFIETGARVLNPLITY